MTELHPIALFHYIVVTLVYSLGFKRFFKSPATLRKPG